jgi:hypothetical protein
MKLNLLDKLNNHFSSEKYLTLTSEELSDLLKSSEIVYEQDTRLRDYIRILQVEKAFYLQETTNRKEILIRKFPNKEEAMKVVDDRLEIYDKMWDGCGCKINYYE